MAIPPNNPLHRSFVTQKRTGRFCILDPVPILETFLSEPTPWRHQDRPRNVLLKTGAGQLDIVRPVCCRRSINTMICLFPCLPISEEVRIEGGYFVPSRQDFGVCETAAVYIPRNRAVRNHPDVGDRQPRRLDGGKPGHQRGRGDQGAGSGQDLRDVVPGNGAFELQGESRVLGIAGQFRLTLESLKSIVRDADSADQFTVSDSSGKSTPGVQKLALGYTYECPRGDRDEYTTTLDVRVGHTTVKLPVKDTSRAWRFQRMPRGKASKSA